MADNASITILRNTQANINAEPIKDGNILFTTDQAENRIYADVGTRRIKIGGTVDVDTTLSTTSTNPVQNKAITNSVNDVRGQIHETNEAIVDVRGQIHTNLLNPTAPTEAINGVTLTNNGDGTYTLNGTTSDVTYFTMTDRFTNLDLSREYKIVGCPQGGSNNTYLLYDDKNREIGIDAGNGMVYKPTNQPRFYIRINKGVTCNNLLFKPMLTTDLNATYNDYVPYSGDGRLNENVAEIHKEVKNQHDFIEDQGIINSRVNGRLEVLENEMKIYEFSVNVTIGTSGMTEYVTKKINLPSDFPQGKAMLLSAAGGAYAGGTYPLPYHSDDFRLHTWVNLVKDVATSQRYVEIRSNVFWENYTFYFAFLLLGD